MLAVFGSLFGSALFVVRGYELEPNVLLVRLFWGGLFVFAGLFTNRRLGRYRAFATQPRNSVVLKFSNRTAVVTPDRPVEFLQALAMFCPQVKIGEGT